jgi:hypothetical protein
MGQADVLLVEEKHKVKNKHGVQESFTVGVGVTFLG